MLWTVIAINATMFVTEMAAGRLAGSQALQADALDFLGDTVTYGISLAVIGMPLRTRALAALGKGVSLLAMAMWVLGSTLWQVLVLGLPRAEVMGVVGGLALGANLASALLLMRYKERDANVRSVWAAPQRCHRERGGHRRGAGRLGQRERLAGPAGRGRHGRAFPRVVAVDLAAGVA